MITLDLHEIHSRHFNGRLQEAVVLKIRGMFDMEGVDTSIIHDALWDSKLRILYSTDLSIIKFSQKSFILFVDLLIKYQTK
jgi:hypothetical protein